MKISEIKGEEALDALCDLLDPVTEIMTDTKVTDKLRNKETRIQGIKAMIKLHKSAVITCLAILDGEDPEEYREKVCIMTLPIRLLELFSEPEVLQLFSSQSQNDSSASSGSVTGNTEAKEN